MKEDLNRIPRLYPDLHIDTVKGRTFVYNPHSMQGILFLPDLLYAILSLVDGKRSLKSVYAKMRSAVPDPAIMTSYIDVLARRRLLHFGQPETGLLADDNPDTFSVWLHLTNQCNLSCSYCFISKSNDHMDFKTLNNAAVRIMDSAYDHGYRKLQFTYGGGEPLLRLTELLESARMISKKASRMKVGISLLAITNGTLLTEKAANALKESGVKIIISIDGTGQYHDKTRYFKNKSGSFTYVMAGLMRALAKQNLDHVKVTVTKHNVEEIPDMVAYFLKHAIKFRLQFFIDNPKATVKTAPDEKMLAASLKKAYKIVEKNLPDYQFADGLLHTLRLHSPIHACGAVNHTFMSVRNDGQIANCNWWLEKNIGSVEEYDPLDRIKEASAVKPLTSVRKDVSCSSCKWRHICSGCPLEFVWDETRTSPTYCKVKKALIPEVIRLEALRILKKKGLS